MGGEPIDGAPIMVDGPLNADDDPRRGRPGTAPGSIGIYQGIGRQCRNHSSARCVSLSDTTVPAQKETGDTMHHHSRLVAAAAALLLVAGTGSTVPASASRSAAPSQAPATALVTNVRWGGHSSFDRLVVDIRGKVPPVTVQAVQRLHYDAIGTEVPLAGKHFLEIRLSPAAAHDDNGRSVYKGPKLTRIWLPSLKGLALTGDFEGVVTLGAAFHTRPSYTTRVLHSPERFVLDIRHAPPVCGR